ncbi:MAG TPA: hypothetical protein VLN49_20170 [Gemmatimonadaceae bacterium]|nr:hypothetical protein [Gemmatimonadaceae bacterium]
MLRRVFLVLLTVVVAIAAQGAGATNDATKRTPEQLKKGIEDQHPTTYYILAQKLFESGKKDEAVFWFYAGQLRYRFHLLANPNLEPSGDPALFASFSEVIGKPINEYAFGDLKTLETTIEKVLTWDKETRNGFTSTKVHHAEWVKTRDGLDGLRTYVMQNGDAIRAQRKANGLPNRH